MKKIENYHILSISHNRRICRELYNIGLLVTEGQLYSYEKISSDNAGSFAKTVLKFILNREFRHKLGQNARIWIEEIVWQMISKRILMSMKI